MKRILNWHIFGTYGVIACITWLCVGFGSVPIKKSHLFSARQTTKIDSPAHQLIYSNNFEQPGLDDWKIEAQKPSVVQVKNDNMEINTPKGCTVWLKKRLHAPISISFAVTVLDKGEPNDRVSDMNVFWMAQDPKHPDNLFARTRSGKFSEYDSLRTYYVGMGGHDNTKTRFRRYTGDGSRPLLQRNDLSSEEFLLKANKRMHIRIEVTRQGTRYFRNGNLIFKVKDSDPYLNGWFGFRTVENHELIHSIKIRRLKGIASNIVE